MEQEEFDKICHSSIKDYLDAASIPYEKQGRYLRLKDHDSLVVDMRVTPERPYEIFYWNSENVGGDLYNFVKHYQGLEGKAILDNIQETLGEKVDKQTHYHYQEKQKDFDDKFYPDQPNHQQVVNYLTQVRKIPLTYVHQFFKIGLIRQLKNGSCGFVWRDQNHKVVGLDQQGTNVDHEKYGKRGTLKKIAKYSESHFGWNFGLHRPSSDRRNVLMVFESPIDAISHAVLAPHNDNCHYRYLSLNGCGTKLAPTVANVLKQADYNFNEIHLCLDNDVPGISSAYDFLYAFTSQEKGKDVMTPRDGKGKKIIVSLEQPNPKFKDWNDALKANSFEIHHLTKETIKGLSEKRNGDFQKMVEENCPYYREIQKRIKRGTLKIVKKPKKARRR